jgi:hypothetical protein
LRKTVVDRWFSSTIVCYRVKEVVGAVKIKVTDPKGVQWSVVRWSWAFVFLNDDNVGGELGVLVLFPVLWPFGFIANLLGFPWKIVIYRDHRQVGREKVRGWNESRQRVQEIAESVAAGTLHERSWWRV